MDDNGQASLVDHVKHRLRFHEWRGRNRLGRTLFVCNSAIEERDLPRWTLNRQRRLEPRWLGADLRPAIVASRSVERDSTPEAPPAAMRTIWTRVEQPDVAVRVDLIECVSREDAHERVVRILADFESPLVGEATGPFGDIAFSGGGAGLILFARANLVYLIRNVGRVAVPVEPIALAVDAAAVPTPDRGVPRSTLQAPMIPASEREDEIVEVMLEDAPPRAAQGCWRYMAPAGDIMIRDGRILYRGPASGVREIAIYR